MVKVLRRMALVLAVILVLLCGATVALMFQKTQMVKNKFEPANVDCVVHEDNTTTSGTRYTNTKNSIKIENIGNIDAYLRVRFVSYWVDAEGNIAPVASKMPEISVTSDWIADLSNNTYYYKYPVSPEDDSQTTDVVEDYTKELLNSPISLGTTTVGSKTYYQVLEVFADAIQSLPAEAVEGSWKVTLDASGVITAVN